MALRLIEMVLSEGEEKTSEVLLNESPIMCFWREAERAKKATYWAILLWVSLLLVLVAVIVFSQRS